MRVGLEDGLRLSLSRQRSTGGEWEASVRGETRSWRQDSRHGVHKTPFLIVDRERVDVPRRRVAAWDVVGGEQLVRRNVVRMVQRDLEHRLAVCRHIEIHKFGCGRRGISIEQPMRQLLQRRPSTRVCNVLYSNWTSALQAREQLQLLQLQLTMRLLRLREFESDSASMYWRRLWRQIAIGSACLIGIGHNASASPTEKNTRDTLRRRAARPPADSTVPTGACLANRVGICLFTHSYNVLSVLTGTTLRVYACLEIDDYATHNRNLARLTNPI